MNKLFLCLLIGLLPHISLAQIRVVALEDTTQLQQHLSELARQYKPLSELFKTQSKALLDAQIQHSKNVQDFLKEKKNLPRPGIPLIQTTYYDANGKASLVLYKTQVPLSDSLKQLVSTILKDFYADYFYPISGDLPFQTSTFSTLGTEPERPRVARKGRGIISTLEEAKQTTRPDTVTFLAFSQLKLTSIPEIVYRFPKLQELDLSRNQIKAVPRRLTSELKSLQRLSFLYNQLSDDSIAFPRNRHLVALNIQGNGLTKIPRSVRHNRKLTSLWMGNNSLSQLPGNSFNGLKHLTDLNLYNAKIKELPRQISKMKRLQVLDVYYNELTELPGTIGKLRQLTALAVSNNHLKTLPEQLGKLYNLSTLYAHHNELSKLPISARNLQNLTVLDLGYNWFSAFPSVLPTLSNLQELDLSNNNLSTFPQELLTLTNLKTVYISRNPFTKNLATEEKNKALLKQFEARQTKISF